MDLPASDADASNSASGPSLSWRLALLAGLLLYWTVLFIGTHLPGDPSFRPTESLPHIDKVVHAAAFAGLAVLLLTGLSGWVRPSAALGLAVLVALALYAGLDEFSQGFVEFRQPDVRDWVADMLGVLVGMAVFFKIWALVTKRRTTR
jgi:VanZ family protein